MRGQCCMYLSINMTWKQSLTWETLACASCSRSFHRWSAGGGWPEWSACCLEQERSPSGDSDVPRRTGWGWPADPPPGTKQYVSEWRHLMHNILKILASCKMWTTFFSISRGSRTSLRRKSWGVSLWGSSTVRSVTISVQILRCCRGLWYGFSCRSDTIHTHTHIFFHTVWLWLVS